jgi:hypothetical protein
MGRGLGENAMDEREARKQRSIAILKAEGVPVLPSLPAIETEAETTLRTKEAVAGRALCLFGVSMKAARPGEAVAAQFVEDFGLGEDLSPAERAFMDDPAPAKHDCVQFGWRIEACLPLLWHLGLVPELGRPDHLASVGAIVDLIEDLGPSGFRTASGEGTKGEALDGADLIYRYHWACRNERMKGLDGPAGLDSGVVQERHLALNWLINYGEDDWDEVTTDT